MNTPEFRVSYPSVFQPKKNDLNGKMEYSVVALFPFGKDDPKLADMKKMAEAAVVKKWGADKSQWPANLKSPFRDQGERAKNVDGKRILPAGYEDGKVFVTLKAEQKPAVVDENVNTIIDPTQFYAGCYAIASINAYAYDQKGNRGVAFGLGNIQKWRDGDSLGGRTRPEDDFSAVATGGEKSGTGSASSLFD